MSHPRYAAALLLLISLLVPSANFARQPINKTPKTSITTGTKVQPAPQQQPQATPTPDPNDPIEKIKDEGMNRSQVMATLSYLTDVIGPRLTASPNMKRANEWTRDQLTKWGLQNGHLESWGPFGRGWELKEFSAQVIAPQAIPLIAIPKAWSPGVNIDSGEVVYVDAKDEAGLQRFKGNLRGKIILTGLTRDVPARFEAPGKRLTEKQLLALADAPSPGTDTGANNFLSSPQFAAFLQNQLFAAKKLKFFTEEGAALLVDSGPGDGGTLFVSAASIPQDLDQSSPMATLRSMFMGSVNAYDKNPPAIVPQMVLAVEHYNRVARMIQAGEKVRMKINFVAQFDDKDLMGYNTIAEIPGGDKKDEIVMLGGHMDSWHGGTGATDNGAGVAVAMEAVRILQALNFKPRRTIRIGLWSGEEQGLFGSQAYVAQHFGKANETKEAGFARMIQGGAASRDITRGAEYDKLSAYFNLDNGTGKIRGVYLQGNEAVRPLFRQWLAPFRDMGAQTLSISNTGGTDHLSFDAIGLPGFQFIQDQVEYDTRTHHSNQDVFDRIQADDMKQAATIMAAFVYNTAMRDEKLPRKSLK
ncbi:MAG TPA: M20/M25/M40 family metallo-hydrolase [Pyrinomonadaceae bacterium]|nr:M20/M25/M40 family metallo-hydrolase [Pyrinomonadaceae bacterium]